MAITERVVMLAQAPPPLAPSPPAALPAGAPDLQLWDKIFHDPLNLILVGLAVAGVVLGIIPLVLYIFERKKSRLLNAMVEQLGLLDQAKRKLAEEEKRGQITKARRAELERDVLAMREDVEQRIPNAALRAYYENTIPQLELQVVDLGARLTSMRGALGSINASEPPVHPRVQTILSEEVSKNIGARRNLEQLQTILVICTAATSAIIAMVPYPLSILLSIPAAIATLFVCFKLFFAARMAFPDNRLLGARMLQSKRIVYVGGMIAAVLVLAVLFGFILLIWHGPF